MDRSAGNSEVSVSLELSERGVAAKIGSRFVSAVDHFLGRKVQKAGMQVEKEVGIDEALSDARAKLIAAAAKGVITQLEGDPHLAASFLHALEKGQAKQNNLEGVLGLAIQDVVLMPAAELEPADAPDKLNEAFLNRFEGYAEQATTEVVREKWAKVLSSEMRKPGTFSNRVLRIIDELDPAVGKSFEKFCENRLHGGVSKKLTHLDQHDLDELLEAGLIHDPSAEFGLKVRVGEDPKHLMIDGTRRMLRFSGTGSILGPMDYHLLRMGADGPVLPVHRLTAVGSALSTLFTDMERETLIKLGQIAFRLSQGGNVELIEQTTVGTVSTLIDRSDIMQ